MQEGKGHIEFFLPQCISVIESTFDFFNFCRNSPTFCSVYQTYQLSIAKEWDKVFQTVFYIAFSLSFSSLVFLFFIPGYFDLMPLIVNEKLEI